MIKDIFMPSRIGSYYIFNKRVLGFELTTTSVQASLLYFSGNTVILENSMNIILQDQNQISIVNAIKKIATTIGQYDEVVTSLISSAVVFKELVLPFIGREKIKMIVAYEVEPLLPFTLDEAIIDFIVTDEDKEKSQTTILVAAVRQSDLEIHEAYFEKAGLQLDNVTLDMFALYDFYRHGMYVAQADTGSLLVDFGIDAIRILYIQKSILKSVRLVPYGLLSMLHTKNDDSSLIHNRILDEFLQSNTQEDQVVIDQGLAQKIIIDFCKQITLSLAAFQKQFKFFIAPSRVICLGVGTNIPSFLEQASKHCQISMEKLDIKKFLSSNNIEVNKKMKIDAQYNTSLIITLSAAHYGDVNYLSKKQHRAKNLLLNKQLFFIVLISFVAIAGVCFYSQYQLNIWNQAYNKSKKEVIHTLKEKMDLDIQGIKRISDIVSVAQNKLEQAKKVCFSCSEQNHSFLRYLQELSSGIDKQSLGLDLKKLSLRDKEVTLQGSVKNWPELDTFIKELIELKNFELKGKLPDVPNDFTVTLQALDDQEKNRD